MSVTLTTEQETKLQLKATRMGKTMMAVLDELAPGTLNSILKQAGLKQWNI